MAEVTFKGGQKLLQHLRRIAKDAGSAKEVKVGFMEGATYPDGTPVAYVAAIQNYGCPQRSIPARPFFTNMVKIQSPRWGEQLGHVLESVDYNGQAALQRMGDGISGQLQESITTTNSPQLSPVTLMLKKMRSEGREITGKTVGEAAARVAAGESYSGQSTKPLVDTAHMQNSVQYEVDGQRFNASGDDDEST